MSALAEMLTRHEGLRLFPYTDTVGKLTIGIGHNLSDNGISDAAAGFLLDEDIAVAVASIRHNCPWFDALDPVRQDAVTDMVFNMGITRFLGFTKTIAALQSRDWQTASMEMLDSTWAHQVGKRATELSAMIETGQYQA